MGSCSTTFQREIPYTNVADDIDSLKIVKRRPHKPIDNELIICGHIREFQKKHSLFAIIPKEICQNIISFIDPNYPISISIPTISIIKSGDKSARINIEDNGKDIHQFRVTFKDDPDREKHLIIKEKNISKTQKSIDKQKQNFISGKYGKYIYDINDLNEMKECQISVCGRNKYDLYGQESNILLLRAYPKWKFDHVTKQNEDCLTNDGKTFTIRRKTGYDCYISASYGQGYKNGVHSFKIQLIGDRSYECSFGITSGNPYISDKCISKDNKGAKYYFYQPVTDTTGIYSNKHTFLCRLAQWKKLDTIAINLDCENWNIEFEIISRKRNEKHRFDQLSPRRTEKIKIEPYKTYYPFVQSRRVGWSFNIVDN